MSLIYYVPTTPNPISTKPQIPSDDLHGYILSTPIGYVLGFISCRYNHSSLPTATLAFCLILQHSKFIPTLGPLYCTCYFLPVMLFPSYVHDWILLAI